MGLPQSALGVLLHEHARVPFTGKALTLGVLDVGANRAQVLSELIRARIPVSPDALAEFTGLEGGVTLDQVLPLLDLEGCDTLDKFAGEGASIQADLNQPLPASLRNAYTLVVDGGTLEHVFDVRQAFANVIDSLQVGGRVLHVSPVAGWENHGFFSFSHKLFARVYSANGFEGCQGFLLHLPRDPQADPTPVIEPASAESEHMCDTLRYRSLLVFCATKARAVSEFVLPVDTHQAATSEPPSPRPPHEARHPISKDAMRPELGHCYTVELPADVVAGQLFEDGFPLSARDRTHADIRSSGGGQHSFWRSSRTTLYFSTSDNSDPRKNGRTYSYCPAEPKAELASDDLAWRNDAAFNAFYLQAQLRCGPGPADRHYVLKELVRSVQGVPGDTAECGVFTGLGSAVICEHRGGASVHHCFDSFEGLSEPTAEDEPPEGVRPWEAGMMEVGLETVRSNLAEYSKVEYHAGWIPECFVGAESLTFCFVHVDVDLHAPTRDAVEFFYERLSPGGIVVCDDYGFLTCPGAKRALDEFLAERPEQLIRLPTGQAYFAKAPG